MDKIKNPFVQSLLFSVTIVAIIWAVHIITTLTETTLTHWGIYPRELDGLQGIITAPLVHGSWEHLVSNSVPLFCLLYTSPSPRDRQKSRMPSSA